MGLQTSQRIDEELGIDADESAPHEDRALGVGRRRVYVDLISAKYLDGHRIELHFEDGRSGVVDFKKFIEKGGIFAQLNNLDFFRKFEVNPELGVITWGEEIDIAPEVLYSEATLGPLPYWMEEETGIRRTA
jgi:hypothetical protein